MTGRCLARVRQPSCQAVAARGSPAEPSSGVPSLTWLPGRRGAVEPPAPAQFLRKTRPRAPAAPKRGELEPRFACFSSWAGLLADDSNRQQIYTRWCSNAIRLLRLLLGIAQSTIGRPHQYPDVPARAAQCHGLAGDHGGDRVAGMHRISIHDPRHDFVISVDVGCGHVALGAQELHDLGSVAASEFFQLAQREQIGIADDAAPGAAEGDVDDGALPRHPGGQGAHLVQVTSGAKRMPPLPGPRAMECWTRYPVKTSRRPSASWTGMWTVISLAEVRGTLRRPSSRLRRVAASSKRASAASQGFFSCSSDNVVLAKSDLRFHYAICAAEGVGCAAIVSRASARADRKSVGEGKSVE